MESTQPLYSLSVPCPCPWTRSRRPMCRIREQRRRLSSDRFNSHLVPWLPSFANRKEKKKKRWRLVFFFIQRSQSIFDMEDASQGHVLAPLSSVLWMMSRSQTECSSVINAGALGGCFCFAGNMVRLSQLVLACSGIKNCLSEDHDVRLIWTHWCVSRLTPSYW